MPRTTFDPTTSGFSFANTFSTNLIADWRFGGLCGGMSYAALDYFFAHRPTPREAGPIRPPDGSVLFNWIYARQVQSIVSNLDKWGELVFNPFGARTDEFFRWGLDKRSGGRIGELMSTVGIGSPVPLGLYREGNGGTGPHHQVVAIGLHGAGRRQPDADIRVEVYDPNTPDRRRMLMPDMAAHRWCYEDSDANERWITYFVDRNYAPKPAPEIAPTPLSAEPELLATLTVAITTGGDDLRGGNDNVDVAVITRGGEMLFTNVNRSARWIDNYQQTITLDLQTPVARSNVLGVELRTRFGGGMGGDNWNVDEVIVTDSGGTVLGKADGKPLVRLTGDRHNFRLPIRA